MWGTHLGLTTAAAAEYLSVPVRLVAAAPAGLALLECEVDILKEIFWRPIAQSSYGPVLAEEDVIGAKVRALADHGAPRDLIEVYAASRRWSNAELEEFGRRHAGGRFECEDLQANLTGAEWTDDEAFTAYGWTTSPSPTSASGPWTGPTTSPSASSKRPMIQTPMRAVRRSPVAP